MKTNFNLKIIGDQLPANYNPPIGKHITQRRNGTYVEIDGGHEICYLCDEVMVGRADRRRTCNPCVADLLEL